MDELDVELENFRQLKNKEIEKNDRFGYDRSKKNW